MNDVGEVSFPYKQIFIDKILLDKKIVPQEIDEDVENEKGLVQKGLAHLLNYFLSSRTTVKAELIREMVPEVKKRFAEALVDQIENECAVKNKLQEGETFIFLILSLKLEEKEQRDIAKDLMKTLGQSETRQLIDRYSEPSGGGGFPRGDMVDVINSDRGRANEIYNEAFSVSEEYKKVKYSDFNPPPPSTN